MCIKQLMHESSLDCISFELGDPKFLEIVVECLNVCACTDPHVPPTKIRGMRMILRYSRYSLHIFGSCVTKPSFLTAELKAAHVAGKFLIPFRSLLGLQTSLIKAPVEAR